MKYKSLPEDSLQAQINQVRRTAIAALILALLLSCALAIGFGVGFTTRIEEAEHGLRTATVRIQNAEMQLLEVIMNSSTPVYTTRLSGTFEYAVQSNIETVIGGSTYQLRDVTIGPLNFTLLELSPPTTPYTFPASFVTDYRFKLRNFVPPLQPTPLFLDDTSQGYPLTQGNVNRVSITGGCFTASTCRLSPDVGDGLIPNTLLFRNPGLTTATNEIQFYLGPKTVLEGQTFTLTQAWILMIPSL